MRRPAMTLLLLGILALPGPTRAEAFTIRTSPVPQALAAQMTGTSWRPEVTCAGRTLACPPLEDLVLLTTAYRDPAGESHTGQLVVSREAAPRIALLLEAFWHLGVPVARMTPVSAFGGSDAASMAANNTSAFNCRCTTGGGRLSNHAAGRALDVNPVQNPFVRGDTVLPAAGRAWQDRSETRPGMLTPESCAVLWARALGFTWGGDWRTLKDWQHLEVPPGAGPAPGLDQAGGRVPGRCRWAGTRGD